MRALVAALAFALLTACGPVTTTPEPSSAPASTSETAPTTTEVPPTTTAEQPTATMLPGPTTTTLIPTPTVTAQPPPVTVTPSPTTTTVVPAPPAGRAYPWHTNIVSTTFWVGEIFDASIPDGSQVCSTYDSQWALHWGGIKTGVAGKGTDCEGSPTGSCDGVPGKSTCATEVRKAPDFWPTKVTPRENPFYLDLPFDDMNDSTGFKTRCTVIPWAKDDPAHCDDTKNSYMKNRWVHLVGASGRDCYGQIEDAGPSSGSAYHDSDYVFGTNDARPANKKFGAAGADVSPALNGCLGFAELDGDGDHIRWQFVDVSDVPPGPWTKVVTTSGVTK